MLAQTAFAPLYEPKIFIMTPAPATEDTNSPSPGIQMTSFGTMRFPENITSIREALAQVLPNVPVATFVYQVQRNPNSAGVGAWGKAMVSANAESISPFSTS